MLTTVSAPGCVCSLDPVRKSGTGGSLSSEVQVSPSRERFLKESLTSYHSVFLRKFILNNFVLYN